MSGPAVLERLDKILSNNGCGSRADVRKLIRTGAVTCDGDVVRGPERKFDANATRIAVGGSLLRYEKYIYLMMNKPEGVISASNDPERRTVVDLLPERYRLRKPFPAGRLDADTTGLLLLTDDGDFAHRILSPKKHVEKEYIARLDTAPDADTVKGFERGVILKDGIRLRPAKLTPVNPGHTYNASGAAARVVLTEGKYHQVKRMFSAYGIRVTGLTRVRMGPVVLDPDLVPGGFRELTASEICSLCNLTGKENT